MTTGTVPLIHCTDLLYPPDDPDDYFDLAAVYAVSEFDLKYVILDQGEKQKERPGKTGVDQMNRITGREIPAAVGLSRKLISTTDKGLDQPAEFQGGVAAILTTLRESTSPVSISVVGSARDITAALNREPELLRSKVKRIYVFAGEASNPNFTEWNVSMDPHAFVGLMRSGLPICWIPCFDGGDWKNGGRASFWNTTHANLLDGVSDPLLQFFIAATQQVTSHPLEFVREPVKPEHRSRLLEGGRNMWGGALLAVMAGRNLEESDEGFAMVSSAVPDLFPPANEIFSFPGIAASFSDAGAVLYDKSDAKPMLQIRINKPDQYGRALTSATAALLRESFIGGN